MLVHPRFIILIGQIEIEQFLVILSQKCVKLWIGFFQFHQRLSVFRWVQIAFAAVGIVTGAIRT